MRGRRARGGDSSSGVTEDEGHEQSIPTQTNCCSICLEEEPLRCPVKTNCGHRFCATCILNLWEHDRPQPCKCPLCRRQVTLLLGAQDFSSSNPTEYRGVLAFNQYMADCQGGWWNKFRDFPTLLQHLRRDTLAQPGQGLPCCSKLFILVLALVALLYLVSPIDLIPEGIFGIFGFVDDILLVLYVVDYSCTFYRNWIISLGQQEPQQVH